MSNQNPLLHVWHRKFGIAFLGGDPSGRPEPLVTSGAVSVPALAASISKPTQPDAPTRAHASVEPTPQKDDGGDDEDCVPPYTPLEFTIPEDVFRNAKRAEPGSPESFWSYRLYRGPGQEAGEQTKVTLHYCKSQQTTERVLQKYFMHEKLVGFDLEWDSNASVNHGARRNISLVQLASPSRIALFHLALYPQIDDLVAPSLKKFMEDPNITKVGVWIKGDGTRLRNYLGIEARGLFELSHLYRLVKFSTSGEFNMINRKLVGLAAQAEEYLKLPLFKGKCVRASEWSQTLQMEQMICELEASLWGMKFAEDGFLDAATDAYAGVHLFAVLDHLRENLDPTPPLPLHAELGQPIRLADGVTLTPKENAARLPAAKHSLDALGNMREDEALAAHPAVTRPAKDGRILEADLWVSRYRLAKPHAKASPSALRSYYIWHKNEDLGPEALAALLRNPPLQTATVVGYILDTIKMEKLAYSRPRLKAVLDLLTPELIMRRYKSIAKACEVAVETDGPEGRNGA